MPTRRETMAGLAGLLMAGRSSAQPVMQGGGEPFSWDLLQQRAQALARRPWQAPPRGPAELEKIVYDVANQVQYRPEKTLWGDAGVRFFPNTGGARRRIGMAVVEKGRARKIAYSPSLYTVPRGHPLTAIGDRGGFSGFRVMNPGGRGDWLAFQGASYFRTAGPLHQYGLSARGLAIDTGTSRPEEFPEFTDFWLERGADPEHLTVYALLDSPSVTGAYRFVNAKESDAMVQDVSSVLFMRRGVAQLGVAPLTSMFWYGEGDRAKALDWRPEVHDSDGLAIRTGKGERLWRPLANPDRPLTNSFADEDPRGFGLLQRDRAFDHYQDDAVFYEKRPSLWIEPRGKWGRGAVTLFQFPTDSEYNDNVAAFWTPAAAPTAGQRLSYDYRLRWIGGEPERLDVARAVEFWRGQGNIPGKPPEPGIHKFVVDFEGDAIAGLTYRSPVKPDVAIKGGRAVNIGSYKVDGRTKIWRFVLDIQRSGDDAVEVRACLNLGNRPITETWLYTLA
ncbi:glucans biosynthesis protein [Sphingomonas zeicaulis]|uniref:glucan biosynthesis protein n=1 Tax=Sphingomonas zeicaulis TaxID=1632740 RepID=UPI003D1CE8E2